jgi:hypothetical protein
MRRKDDAKRFQGCWPVRGESLFFSSCFLRASLLAHAAAVFVPMRPRWNTDALQLGYFFCPQALGVIGLITSCGVDKCDPVTSFLLVNR